MDLWTKAVEEQGGGFNYLQWANAYYYGSSWPFTFSAALVCGDLCALQLWLLLIWILGILLHPPPWVQQCLRWASDHSENNHFTKGLWVYKASDAFILTDCSHLVYGMFLTISFRVRGDNIGSKQRVDLTVCCVSDMLNYWVVRFHGKELWLLGFSRAVPSLCRQPWDVSDVAMLSGKIPNTKKWRETGAEVGEQSRKQEVPAVKRHLSLKAVTPIFPNIDIAFCIRL